MPWNPTSSDLHVDALQSRYAQQFRNSDYGGDRIFPVAPVSKQSDLYRIYFKGEWFRSHVEVRAPGDTYPFAGYQVSTGSYFCDVHHLAHLIPDEKRDNNDDVDLDRQGSEFLADQFMLERELQLAAQVFAGSVWTTNTDVTNEWDDYTNGTPVADMLTAMQTMQLLSGKRPNRGVMSPLVMDILLEHPDFIAKFQYTQVGILDAEDVAAVLRMPANSIVSPRCIKNTAAEVAPGTDALTGAYIWAADEFVLLNVDGPAEVPAEGQVEAPADSMNPSAGRIFQWTGVSGGGSYRVPITRERPSMRDSDALKAKSAWDSKVTAPELGVRLHDLITG